MATFLYVLLGLAAVVGVIYFFVSRGNSTPQSTPTTPGRTQTLPDSGPDPHKPGIGLPGDPVEEETIEDLMSNTKNQLLDIARDRGVKVSVRMSKSNIAQAIKYHENVDGV